jgi:predicted amidohydrolase
MNIATVASDTIWKDAQKNIEQTEQHVARVLQLFPKTQIILFPELSLAGFVVDPSNQDIAESMNGYCVTEIRRIARKYGIALICGMVEKNPHGKPFNTQFIISSEGQLIVTYHKNHLFTQTAEPEVFSPGEELVVFEFDGWKCGLATCFDIRFPRLFEAYKTAGVECIFMGCNWVKGRNKPAIMEYLAKVRAHENQSFFVAVDRTGSDPNTSYYGTSVIANPYAEDLAARQGIYSYAEISKDDIVSLSNLLPLKSSFRQKYHIAEIG